MQVHIEFELTVSLVFLVEVPKELLIIRHRALPAHVIFITKPGFSLLLLPNIPRILLFSQSVQTRACLTTTHVHVIRANHFTPWDRNAR